MEENILRACSTRRPDIYQGMSDEKEEDMRLELKKRLKHRDPKGPIKLPNPTPDIDLILIDEASSTVVIGELKWNRKSLLPREIPGKDVEVLKGITQLTKIRCFLADNPKYLKDLGIALNDLGEYEHVFYLLIPRDHWPWFEPTDEVALVEFDAFAKVAERPGDLLSAVQLLLTYEWLPIQGRDFTVRLERATVNGVSVESQIFYAAL